MTCPRCGADADGRFCSNCGASLGAAACATCGAPLTAGAKFCHVCGRATAVTARTVPAWVPWALVGAMAAALIVVVVGRSDPAASPEQTPVASAPTGGGVPPTMRGPDISGMSARERADALFNRVMGVHERGLSDSVAFFTPMALAAYRMVGELDRDGHYHVGLIHAVTGNADAARAHADTIARGAPDHLFASIVRLEAAEAAGDDAARARAARAFLEAFEAERARDRPEYADHPGLLEGYRQRLSSG